MDARYLFEASGYDLAAAMSPEAKSTYLCTEPDGVRENFCLSLGKMTEGKTTAAEIPGSVTGRIQTATDGKLNAAG